MAKNIDVIKEFVNGGTKVKTKNLHIEADTHCTRLFNYDTCIAERTVLNDELQGFKVNMTKYSVSTTTIQNKVVSEIKSEYKGHINVYSRMPIGVKSLWKA